MTKKKTATKCPCCEIQKDIKPELQRKLAPLVFKHLYNGITEDDILRLEGRQLIHKGVALSPEQKSSIIMQAGELKSNNALIAILQDLKYTANKKIFDDSESVEDIIAAKMALWVIDLIEKKIVNLSNLKL